VRAVAVARATVARVASFDKGIFYSKCVQVGDAQIVIQKYFPSLDVLYYFTLLEYLFDLYRYTRVASQLVV